MKKHLKALIGIGLVVTTGIVFTWYMSGHPEIIDQLKNLSPLTLATLIALYAVWFGALIIVLQISVRMYDKTLSIRENTLLSAYSSLINFFGPGQSGPGLRGIYLKKRHNMRIKDYIFATLLYYACYAIISACFMFIGTRTWWQTMLLMAAAAVTSWLAIKLYMHRSKITQKPALFTYTGWIFAATLAQLVIQTIIYAVELRALDSAVSWGQIISYTGSANFALFAALTPGAIGIREALLVFTQSLHHIDSTLIVAANVIDRSAYIAFLGILAVGVFGLHADKKFRLKQMTHDNIK